MTQMVSHMTYIWEILVPSVDTQPLSPQLTKLQLTSTESSLNKRQPNSKRKQTNLLDSVKVVSTTDQTTDQDMVIEDQELSNPIQTRTSVRPLTTGTRDITRKSQLSSKKTLSRLGKTRKLDQTMK